MSLARITSGVLAGFVRSSGCAPGTTRKAPPVPVALAWQPEPAQVLVEVAPPCWIVNGALRIGLMQRWKYANDRRWPDAPAGVLTAAGLANGFDDEPPQPASTASAATAALAATPRRAPCEPACARRTDRRRNV